MQLLLSSSDFHPSGTGLHGSSSLPACGMQVSIPAFCWDGEEEGAEDAQGNVLSSGRGEQLVASLCRPRDNLGK